ncbi:MAG: MotA/TolQ/ExbB proton channel family protein [Planctomycetales bacterium]
MNHLLDTLSSLSTTIIAVAGAVHLVLFVLLWLWYRHDLHRIAAALDDFTRGIKHRSLLDRSAHLSDQIEAFLADVNETLDDPARAPDRAIVLGRINVLDEKRKYLQSMGFEISYNVCRSMIEAYPLGGILGTILAIGLVVQQGEAATPGMIVERFGQAIWSTCAGLVAAVVLMFFNSLVETSFLRLSENRQHVERAVGRVKRALALDAGGRS